MVRLSPTSSCTRFMVLALLSIACGSDSGLQEGDPSTSSADHGDGHDVGSDGDTHDGSTDSTDGETDGETGGETGGESITYQGEVWADNWSAVYLGETLIMEDSVPITTERSFNLETFTFEATPPFLLNVVMKDFIENDSGLEYIGQPNQQMGDGGYIAQFTKLAGGELAAVSNGDWRCTTIHEAPLNKDCETSAQPLVDCQAKISEEPVGWMAEDFDDSAWVQATVHGVAAVDPKQGYLETEWDPSAQFIWGSDLESHNTILCRVWISQ